MGKSPGKWIKTILFGKKTSKSNLSRHVATVEKKAAVKAPVGDVNPNPEVLSYQVTERATEVDFETVQPAGVPSETPPVLPVNQSADLDNGEELNPVDDAEIRSEEQAATKVQASFRGYLARRAFRALKGIIRLQALIRGHLVRRQAVATLRCMLSIVKFQALARGRIARLSDPRCVELQKYDIRGIQMVLVGRKSPLAPEKLATNAFICKYLAKLQTAIPLSLQYDVAEPNSSWNWLERWSISHFWVPPAKPKKTRDPKSRRRQPSTQILDTEAGKSKRTIRKPDNNNGLASLELEKLKRNPRKVVNHQTEGLQEQQPQNELERVKRSLRKVSASASEKSPVETDKPHLNLKKSSDAEKSPVEADKPHFSLKKSSDAEKLPVETDKPHVSLEQSSDAANFEILDQEPVALVQKPLDLAVEDLKLSSPVAPPEPLSGENEFVQVATNEDFPKLEAHSLENGEKIETNLVDSKEDYNGKEDSNSKENQKSRRRSLPAKDYTETVQQKTPNLPSYMQATESAKAKLRAQGQTKIGEEVAENGYVRRHSLPASTNGKLSSSPRVQRPTLSNGKSGNKNNKSMTLSRDDKVGWRR